MTAPLAAPYGTATLATVSDLRLYLSEVPQGEDTNAVLQAALDRAEALVRRQLLGVELLPPAEPDVVQVILEVASSIYLTRGTSSLIEVIGAEAQESFTYVGQLNSRQKASLLQYRISQGGVAV